MYHYRLYKFINHQGVVGHLMDGGPCGFLGWYRVCMPLGIHHFLGKYHVILACSYPFDIVQLGVQVFYIVSMCGPSCHT